MVKNKSKNNAVVVTGLGPISSLGIGKKEAWDALLAMKLNLIKENYSIGEDNWGEFYLHKMRDFNINKFDLPKQNFKFIKELRNVKKEDTDLYYFLATIKLALEDSRLKYDTAKNDIGLIITQENPGLEIFFEELIDSAYEIIKKNTSMSKLGLAKALYNKECEDRGYNLQTFSYLFSAAKVFDLHGYSLFLNNACASGLFAIEAAARQIRSGVSPAVIVSAIDNPTKIYKYLWFKRYGLYAEDGITRPFSKDANGIVFGDGGAALVLEDMEHARKRGAEIYAEYLGGGFSLEGWKVTVPNISDDFYAQSLKRALDISGVKPDEIDFVNPHGVGMKVTDRYEADAINSVFKGKKPLIGAFKPLVGHNLGGSALLETVILMLTLKNEMIPATLNCENIDERLKLNIVHKNTKVALRIVSKMSCGFAGFNGVAIFRKFHE